MLPKQRYYNVDKSSTNPCVVIKLVNRHYVPNNSQSVAPISLPKDDLAFNRSMSEILAIITDDQMRIKHKFDTILHSLEAFIALGAEKGGLNKADLLGIYVKWVRPNNIWGKKHYAGTEFGNQPFFEMIMANEKNDNNAVPPTYYETYIVYELAYAIARAISIGQMSADVIYKDNQAVQRSTKMNLSQP